MSIWGDVRYGVKILLKRPGFTVIAILTLALGIGANSAIFSVVNAVLLRPLPYPEPEQLLRVSLADPQVKEGRGAYGAMDFLAAKERNQSFAALAAFYAPGNGFSLSGREIPEQVPGALVTAQFFDVLQVKAAQGRTFAPAEDRPAAARAIVVSHTFWQQRLNADANVIGQAVTLDGESHTVIGVMPPDFSFALTGTAEFWAVLQLELPRYRPPYYLNVVGRLKPSVSAAQAQSELSGIAAQVQTQFPGTSAKAVTASPLKDSIIGDARLALLVLFSAVLFVLLIALVNVANLLLARAAEREKEMAVRAALGAGRWRLLRQVLTESLLLALAGGALGWMLALWGVDLILSAMPENLPRMGEVRLDARVLGFTVLLSLASGIFFSVVPAWQNSRLDLNATLKEGGRAGGTGGGRRGLRSVLVIGEFAVALMLLIGAGLMIHSFLQLQRVNAGFNPDHVLTAQITLPEVRYREASQVAAFHQRLLQRVQGLPGVESASLSMALPPNLLVMRNPFTLEGRPPSPGQTSPLAQQLLVSPAYFRTLGIRLQAGRDFTDADKQDAPEVIIINETMARQYFPNQDPVGRRLQTGDYDAQGSWATIVGVVEDVKYAGLNEAPDVTMYTPFAQNLWWRSMYLAIRTSGDPLSYVTALRHELKALDGDLPLSRVSTLEQVRWNSIGEPRVYTLLLGLFGAVALLLAAIGIYGVMAYTVAQRTHEIGIRMALGAGRGDVLRLVVGQGMKLALVGTVGGLLGAFGLMRLMKSLLFGVSATDPLTFAGVAVLLMIVAFLACVIPARRATKVDPLVALRYE